MRTSESDALTSKPLSNIHEHFDTHFGSTFR